MTPTEYRAQAEAMRTQAKRSKDAAVREQMLLMAQDWDRLAADAEELERRRAAAKAPKVSESEET